ncbi:major capsid protein [Microvirus mar57]|uniref:Major capsid protein n=1 Tax=Microvirus mar57 TaxID=2851193 RepID=A0A8F6AI53_9VIRU|nr:major capsid protein [Microvirus mar57]
MSVWSKEHNPETSIRRNVFPQSFSNNLTMNFGGIYPFLCQEVMSGDTMEIDSAMGLRFMPTIWPLQNRIRADVHYFYVRNRNLYNEFKEYYTGGTINKSMPFLSDMPSSFFDTGSLADYLNIPTVVNLSDGDSILPFDASSTLIRSFYPKGDYLKYCLVDPSGNTYGTTNLPVVGTTPTFFLTPDIGINPFTDFGSYEVAESTLDAFLLRFAFLKASEVSSPGLLNAVLRVPSNYLRLTASGSLVGNRVMFCPVVMFAGYFEDGPFLCPVPAGPWRESSYTSSSPAFFGGDLEYDLRGFNLGDYLTHLSSSIPSVIPDDFIDRIKSGLRITSVYFGVSYFDILASTQASKSVIAPYTSEFPFSLEVSGSSSIPVSSLGAASNPFMGSTPKVPLNALPFRAYEQIYNAFFRDERNNPLLINGKPYYDKYLPSTDGGADAYRYSLHYRNWEQDFLTTALPSPQQGEAPLVGISAAGVMSLSDPETGQVYHAQAITADDADTIVGAKFIETNQDGTSIPNNVARSLVSYATSGISINDFRNVNALQRYLETNLRRGLKYKDLVSARWGVNISYAEMNMPEFIGGFTEYVNPAQVNQTSQDTSSSPLGAYAGQLYCNGQQKHKIRHFCDEEGFIIGVISVVPVPVYSQLLPKMFTKFDRLDYFQPEFGHIGMQPIPMKEVAPLQVAINGGNQDETFGYQRAWYDYLGRVDEVHGQFRGSLRDFLMYRTFSGIPRLSEDFLLVDNRPLDNVFSVQKDADGNSIDKILGQIYVDIVAKRPIPRFGIPRLE